MSTTMTVDEAQTKLKQLIGTLAPGDEVVLTENQEPVAKLVVTPKPAERKLGTLKGTVLYMSPDFDAPLAEFREYMP
jgi:antitoxin (DNA-binding transcriptional repressor) of toxin-antitoxin stability system